MNLAGKDDYSTDSHYLIAHTYLFLRDMHEWWWFYKRLGKCTKSLHCCGCNPATEIPVRDGLTVDFDSQVEFTRMKQAALYYTRSAHLRKYLLFNSSLRRNNERVVLSKHGNWGSIFKATFRPRARTENPRNRRPAPGFKSPLHFGDLDTSNLQSINH